MTDLAALQAEIEAERARRGFTTDPVKLLALLAEEVGEVARALKPTWSPNYGAFDSEALAAELADVAVLVCALAAGHGIDLEAAIRAKFFGADGRRAWASARTGDDPAVVRDIEEEAGGRRLRLVTRLDRSAPPADHITTAHCLAFAGDAVVLARHHTRGWTIPGGHLEAGESPEEAMAREAREEAGIVVAEPVLFAHERIEAVGGAAPAGPYPSPAFQVFYVARLVSMGDIAATTESSEARLFAPDEARQAPGWIQRNRGLYEAALALARSSFGGARVGTTRAMSDQAKDEQGGDAPADERVARRAAHPLAEERAAGTDDPEAQAAAVLEDSDIRSADRDAAPGSTVEHRTSDEATPPVDD